ncbi:hypothetical protein HD806DRAFT_538518 [Xylariaceae sp. AK1471]|nr:hypothetical protein HD806DRAFT_538518 [Xylariaceae sp. AK1471]
MPRQRVLSVAKARLIVKLVYARNRNLSVIGSLQWGLSTGAGQWEQASVLPRPRGLEIRGLFVGGFFVFATAYISNVYYGYSPPPSQRRVVHKGIYRLPVPIHRFRHQPATPSQTIFWRFFGYRTSIENPKASGANMRLEVALLAKSRSRSRDEREKSAGCGEFLPGYNTAGYQTTGQEMDTLKQNIAEIDSAIIEARLWLKEAKTDKDTEDRQAQLDQLEADLVAEQAKLDAKILEDENNKG